MARDRKSGQGPFIIYIYPDERVVIYTTNINEGTCTFIDKGVVKGIRGPIKGTVGGGGKSPVMPGEPLEFGKGGTCGSVMPGNAGGLIAEFLGLSGIQGAALQVIAEMIGGITPCEESQRKLGMAGSQLADQIGVLAGQIDKQRFGPMPPISDMDCIDGWINYKQCLEGARANLENLKGKLGQLRSDINGYTCVWNQQPTITGFANSLQSLLLQLRSIQSQFADCQLMLRDILCGNCDGGSIKSRPPCIGGFRAPYRDANGVLHPGTPCLLPAFGGL